MKISKKNNNKIFKDFSFKKSNLPGDLIYLDMDNLLLLPTGEQTITISEPRHLNLIDKVLQDPQRIVAIIPTYNKKFISDIGCAGKIVSFNEHSDGYYVVTVVGVCRFHIDILTSSNHMNNTVTPIWFDFLDDLDLVSQKINNRNDLNDLVYDYLNIYKESDIPDFSGIQEISDTQMLSLLASKISYDTNNQEQLIRAKNLTDISKVFQNIMELQVAEHESKVNIKH